MIWTRGQFEHDWFIPKDIWLIFYSEGLVDFFHIKWQIYCLTGATIKLVQRKNNIFKLILHRPPPPPVCGSIFIKMYVYFICGKKFIINRPHSAYDFHSVTLCCDLLWLAELVESCTQLARVPVIQVLAHAQLSLHNREYWMVYRRPDFLASSPRPPLSPVSKLDRPHTGRLRIT